MNSAIIGFGKIGQALAKAFARKGINVAVAANRSPDSLTADAAAIGPTIIPKTLTDAVCADIIFLAVRFESHLDVAKALPTWKGKTIIDVTNAYGVSPDAALIIWAPTSLNRIRLCRVAEESSF